MRSIMLAMTAAFIFTGTMAGIVARENSFRSRNRCKGAERRNQWGFTGQQHLRRARVRTHTHLTGYVSFTSHSLEETRREGRYMIVAGISFLHCVGNHY